MGMVATIAVGCFADEVSPYGVEGRICYFGDFIALVIFNYR
jgi:hypothetical protein